MTGIVKFQALAFDLVDGCLVEDELVGCASSAIAIQAAQGQWRVFGHAGVVALSRTTDFEKRIFGQKHVLRRFGQVSGEFLTKTTDE
jgi:hypothetical protein